MSGGLTRSYAYDANGDQTSRTISGTTYALGYDFDDQMTAAGSTTYSYDAGGRRVNRTAGGTTTSFQYDGGSVLLEKQGGSTTATYTYGNALIRKDGETPLFDGLGSERTVTSSTGSVTTSLTPSAFGQTVASSGSSTSAYQFGATSGYRSEGDAGLTLVGCRFYDAQVGRFITRDTYLNQKPYAYCDGDPVNCVDPSGHVSRKFWWSVLVVATGVFGEVVDNYEHPGPIDPIAPPIQLKVPGRGGGPGVPTGISVGGGPPPPDDDSGDEPGGGATYGGGGGGAIYGVVEIHGEPVEMDGESIPEE